MTESAKRVAFVAGATGYTGVQVVRQLAALERTPPLRVVAHVRPDSTRLAEWRTRFEGELRRSRWWGHGVVREPGGEVYAGEFIDGMRHGLGVSTAAEHRANVKRMVAALLRAGLAR